MTRRAAKVDTTQNEIVDALLRCGCSARSLAPVGGGCPDILASISGETFLIEAKTPKNDRVNSETHRKQRIFAEHWQGALYRVESADDVPTIVARHVQRAMKADA